MDDDGWMAFSHAQRRQRTERPSQSNFRVTAVIVLQFGGDSTIKHIVGHNDEACTLVNSICAERAAFAQMAGLFAPRGITVTGVYITTDAPHAVTPGAMCREFMLSSRHTLPSTRIVMEGDVGVASRCERTLEQLLPYASIYTRLKRTAQRSTGEQLSSALANQRRDLGGHEGAAWRAAFAACTSDRRDELHPIKYGAAVVFRDGHVATAWQKKALEYGCSLDAICQLAPAIEERMSLEEHRASPPVVICMCDQFGVLHGPFAPARAYLCEHGYGATRVLIHDQVGVAHAPTVEELLPGLPLMGNLADFGD